MGQLSSKAVKQLRFTIGDLQKRIAVLDATREDLERQIQKLINSVPEEEIEANAERAGYVAYGSYAQSVINRRNNIRTSLEDITLQHTNLTNELNIAVDALDSFERVRARQMAAKAEKKLARKSA